MIKVLIIEDEIPARKKIKRLLEELSTPNQVLAEIDTVGTAISFLKNNTVDLIFSDIELLDGNAFDIYREVHLNCPIIFTTAYDQFWMDAFDTNGIAYLLKPFSKERFQKAWDKFLLLRNTEDVMIERIAKLMEQNFLTKAYKKRFTIRLHQGIYFLDTEKINFFEACDGVLFAYDILGKKHVLSESTLKEIEEQLDPSDFFRINRSELICKKYVEKIERYNKNSLAVKLQGHQEYLKTSQTMTAAFRSWIED
ncbi:LytTR family DNA-binding domain-containing protein [Sphingobacterium faecium]|uniref:LytR/AlgR family response regulator transcription factor n=1 Tax=Sphingobacterium faecium TaxID=34087 RepID=UPI00320A2AC5